MTLTTEFGDDLLQTAENLVQWSAKLLKDAPLTKLQLSDLEAVYQYANLLRTYIVDERAIIDNYPDADPKELQRVRHQILNHLNIVVGFTGLIIKELPDNLLLYMITVRDIHNTGTDLIERVQNMR